MNKPIVLSQPPFPDFSLAIVAYVRLIPTSLNLFHILWKHQSPYEVCLSKTLFPQPGILFFPCQLFSFSFWNSAQILAPRQSLSLHGVLLKTCVTMLFYFLMNLVIFLPLATRM